MSPPATTGFAWNSGGSSTATSQHYPGAGSSPQLVEVEPDPEFFLLLKTRLHSALAVLQRDSNQPNKTGNDRLRFLRRLLSIVQLSLNEGPSAELLLDDTMQSVLRRVVLQTSSYDVRPLSEILNPTTSLDKDPLPIDHLSFVSYSLLS